MADHATTPQGAEAAGAVSCGSEDITKDELTELVRAIKFAKPDASMRAVHREISEELCNKPGFAFLANVKQTDVKKVWKKAQQQPTPAAKTSTTATTTTTTMTTSQQPQDHDNNIPTPPQAQGAAGALPNVKDGLKLYTVGNASLKTLAEEYSQAAAAKAMAATASGGTTGISADEYQKYVHVFLDVPGDRSGSRPHQALINFQDNCAEDTSRSNTSKKQGKKNRGSNSKTKNSAGTGAVTGSTSQSNIVKIQVAASPVEDGEEAPKKYPMLLYNADRSQKTFIHPDDDEDQNKPAKSGAGGYDKIRDIIATKGMGGSLGAAGGTKAYFYSRLTKRKNGPNILSIDVTSDLAPEQPW